MKTRAIGALQATIVGVGCNNFGGRLDANTTAQVVHAALDAGINFFDTADIYGGTKSEEFLGQALGTRRDDILIASKFGIKLDEARPGGAAPEYIQTAIEDSLRRLGTDRIDLYQLHTPDKNVPIADTLAALDKAVQAGKVREIGCFNFSAEQLREAEEAAKTGARFVSVQNHYSMLHREPEQDGVLAGCEHLNLALLPYFPLANGLLTGKYRKNQPRPEGTRLSGANADKWLTEQNLDLAESLLAFAQSHGHSLLELAFAWLLAQPTVASVIAGATKVEQINANAAAADWQLNREELDTVNNILITRQEP